LTSANFSKAAWGDEKPNGGLVIENFELGVCIEQAVWPFEQLFEFEDSQNAATSTNKLQRSSRFITWAQATWDGKSILVECKCERNVAGHVMSRKAASAITQLKPSADGLRTARIRWADAKQQPTSVVLKCESEELSVVVFDARKLVDRESSFPDEVDESEVQAIRDKLLFEQYGGKAVTDADSDSGTIEEVENQNAVDVAQGQSGHTDSFAVEAFVTARQHLLVVDCWAGEVKKAKPESLVFLQRDGRLLMDAFNRQAARSGDDQTGARLAAEELELRLKHFSKE
jgi:hypothetical protein